MVLTRWRFHSMGQTLRSSLRTTFACSLPVSRLIPFFPTCSLLLPWQARKTGNVGSEAANPVVSRLGTLSNHSHNLSVPSFVDSCRIDCSRIRHNRLQIHPALMLVTPACDGQSSFILSIVDTQFFLPEPGLQDYRLNLVFCDKNKIWIVVLSVWTLAECEWRAAAQGLKPLRLPCAPHLSRSRSRC